LTPVVPAGPSAGLESKDTCYACVACYLDFWLSHLLTINGAHINHLMEILSAFYIGVYALKCFSTSAGESEKGLYHIII